MTKTGSCFCGAVQFVASEIGTLGACHCTSCQRWTGGPLLGVTVPEAAMAVTGSDHVVTRRTSGWASRSNCGSCGSPLWYRYDKGEDGSGHYEVPLGLFDEQDDIPLTKEIFIDFKPAGFDFAGDHPRRTRAEVMPSFDPS
ncbi:GFA family protein [Pseudoroseicyclus tamaricis]|uniref:GFA family protein n=1 Tax=Pseudoroseicyclus tamaricis TaxID=2705421 RepID=A0A6B2K2R8_9RHOB|nr:GFA family protein [Pseudoroseicyclus tamaricis]NDV02904.1 GFA family protein [Pseudoroseicyclus tamaricis]